AAASGGNSRPRRVQTLLATCRSWITTASAAGDWHLSQASRHRRSHKQHPESGSLWTEGSLSRVCLDTPTAVGCSVVENSIGKSPASRGPCGISVQRASRL